MNEVTEFVRESFCANHKVRLVPKSELRLMRITAWLLSLLPRRKRPVSSAVVPKGTQVKTAEGNVFTVVRRNRGFYDYDVTNAWGAHGSITVQGAVELVDRGREFMTEYWTTYRLPFTKAVIAHPDGLDPMRVEFDAIREHEKAHLRQWKMPLAVLWFPLVYFLFPLPIVFTGRWFLERRPYLVQMRAKQLTPERAAEMLWSAYVLAWPKKWAVRWWRRELSKLEPF